jgi:hypothetical protein
VSWFCKIHRLCNGDIGISDIAHMRFVFAIPDDLGSLLPITGTPERRA